MTHLQTRQVTDPSISPPPPLPPAAPSSSGRSGEEPLKRYLDVVLYWIMPLTCNRGAGDFLGTSGSLTGKAAYSAGPRLFQLITNMILPAVCIIYHLKTLSSRGKFVNQGKSFNLFQQVQIWVWLLLHLPHCSPQLLLFSPECTQNECNISFGSSDNFQLLQNWGGISLATTLTTVQVNLL